LFEFLSKFFSSHDPSAFAYGILQPCRRCVYAKKYDPSLIITKDRGPRVIVNLSGKCYTNKGECVGYHICGNCFSLPKDLPCRWVEF
jgi:hypothetical protein